MGLAEDIKNKGGFFYTRPRGEGFDICLHFKGDTVDKVIETVKESAVLRTLMFYHLKYCSEGYVRDRVADFDITLEEIEKNKNEVIEKFRAIPSRDELFKMPLKGDGGLLALCKDMGMDNYSRLTKEMLVEAILCKLKEV